MSYFVIELQTNGNQGAVLATAYETIEDAKAAAYSLASVAVKSTVEKHTVMCVNAYGFNILDPMAFEHTPVEHPAKKSSK